MWLGLSIIIGSGLVSGGCMWLSRSFGQWTAQGKQTEMALMRINETLLRIYPSSVNNESNAAIFVNIDEDLDIPPAEQAS